MTQACCCGELAYVEPLPARDLLCGIEGEWNVVRCAGNALKRTHPQPDETTLASYYPREYHPHVAPDPTSTPVMERLRRTALASLHGYPSDGSIRERWLGRLLGLVFWRRFQRYPKYREYGRLLDVGCGGGFQLEDFRRRGWQVMGLDISQGAVDRVRARGIEAMAGKLEDVDLGDARFDAITMNESLEHMANPQRVLKAARRLLRDDGELVISVPRADSWLARAFGSNWFALDVPRHLYHFTPSTLEHVLRRAGFTVVQVRSIQAPENTVFSWIFQARRSRGAKHAPLQAGRLRFALASALAWLVDLFDSGDTLHVRARACAREA